MFSKKGEGGGSVQGSTGTETTVPAGTGTKNIRPGPGQTLFQHSKYLPVETVINVKRRCVLFLLFLGSC